MDHFAGFDRLLRVTHVRIDGDVVLARLQDVVVATAYQDLAGSGSRRVEMSGRDGF